jgi:hypothetical protein
MTGGELVCELPVGGDPQAVEQARRAQGEGGDAVRGDDGPRSWAARSAGSSGSVAPTWYSTPGRIRMSSARASSPRPWRTVSGRPRSVRSAPGRRAQTAKSNPPESNPVVSNAVVPNAVVPNPVVPNPSVPNASMPGRGPKTAWAIPSPSAVTPGGA